MYDPRTSPRENLGASPYNWATDEAFVPRPSGRAAGAPDDGGRPRRESSRTSDVAGAVGAAAGGFVGGMGSSFVPPVNVNANFGGGNGGGGNGGGNTGGATAGGGADRHQGDRLIYQVERIEFRSEKDILALAKAINHLGRELHLILGMRAEELTGVLSQYRGKWYTFGASSRVKARLVSAHLKVSAEAAKALGVGALKMAHAFDRHFVKPEQEAKQQRTGKKARPTFTIGED
ncbi:hypothetical protein ACWGCC_30405 [Streptomyces nigrescens]